MWRWLHKADLIIAVGIVVAPVRAVGQSRGLTRRELDQLLQQKNSRLSKIGCRLVGAGLLEKRCDGMVVRFFPVTADRV